MFIIHINIYCSSIIAEEFLKTWPEPAKKFVKVFPYEYQRALKTMAAKQPSQAKVESNGKENGVLDIEETVRDVELETKNLEKILDKTRYVVSRRRCCAWIRYGAICWICFPILCHWH